MTMPAPSAAIQHVLATATNALQKGDLTGAEITLAPFFRGQLPANPDLLNIAGTLRMNQGRQDEAAALFNRAVLADPREPTFSFNLGLALWRLGRNEPAEAGLRTALRSRPDFVPALFEL